MNPKVDLFLAEGCGRCPLVATPQCKTVQWREDLRQLRMIVLDTGLTEEFKWSHPTYTYNNSNILILGAFKEYCSLGFVKGALLQDPEGVLVKQTENVQSTRLIKFTDARLLAKLERTIKEYIYEAIEVEKSGLKVKYKKTSEYKMPAELENRLKKIPAFKKAFNTLTPGRQRGYILHFSQPKQSKTREERIDKCTKLIMQGIGLHDDYRSKKK